MVKSTTQFSSGDRLQVREIMKLDKVPSSQNIDRNAMDLAGHKDYMYILIRLQDSPNMVFLEVINWATEASNCFLISSTVCIWALRKHFSYSQLQALDLSSAKSGITDNQFLIHSTWGDCIEITFYDLETVNSSLSQASIIPLEPKYSHTFSFMEGQVSQWSRVDTVWDDRICTSTVQSQQDSNTQILTLAELDISPNVDESIHLTTTLRCSVHLMKDPYGNHILHSGHHGKILMWKAYRDEGEDDGDSFIIKFAGRPGLADVRDEDHEESRVMSFIPPTFIHEHGVLYDMDFDDVYGRLLFYMADGTIFVFEFI